MSDRNERVIALLERIANAVETLAAQPPARRRKPKNKTAARTRALVAQGRFESDDPKIPTRVTDLWKELCYDCPQPVAITPDRAETLHHFWHDMDGEEGVRNVFQVVAGNDWLSGRPVGRGRDTRQRSSGIGLFEVITNVLPIIEGTHR